MALIAIIASAGLAAAMNAPVASPLGAELRPVNASQAQEKSGVAIAGLLAVTISPNGIADDLGLKADDVIHSVNQTRTTTLQDLTSAGITAESSISIEFARDGRIRVTERAAKPRTQLKVAFVGAESSEAATLLRNAGMAVHPSSGFPQSLNEFEVVVVENQNAATPANAAKIEEYLRHGGGVVLLRYTPAGFANTNVPYQWEGGGDLSLISSWFGATGIQAREDTMNEMSLSNSFDSTKLRNNDTVWKFQGSITTGSVLGLGDYAMSRGSFNGRNFQSRSGAHTNEYVRGRVFWTFLPHDHQYPKLGALFVAGTEWVAKR